MVKRTEAVLVACLGSTIDRRNDIIAETAQLRSGFTTNLCSEPYYAEPACPHHRGRDADCGGSQAKSRGCGRYRRRDSGFTEKSLVDGRGRDAVRSGHLRHRHRRSRRWHRDWRAAQVAASDGSSLRLGAERRNGSSLEPWLGAGWVCWDALPHETGAECDRAVGREMTFSDVLPLLVKNELRKGWI